MILGANIWRVCAYAIFVDINLRNNSCILSAFNPMCSCTQQKYAKRIEVKVIYIFLAQLSFLVYIRRNRVPISKLSIFFMNCVALESLLLFQ